MAKKEIARATALLDRFDPGGTRKDIATARAPSS